MRKKTELHCLIPEDIDQALKTIADQDSTTKSHIVCDELNAWYDRQIKAGRLPPPQK